MASPKPTPTALKRLRGNPGNRPLNLDEPKFEIVIPECPEFLDEIGRKEWDEVTLELFNAGVLAKVDKACLAAYCQNYSILVQASKVLNSKGVLVKTASKNGYPVQNPALAIVSKAQERMLRFATEYGLTPSSRTKVKGVIPDSDDPMADLRMQRFLNGPGASNNPFAKI